MLNKCDKDGLFITDKYVFFFGGVFSNFYKSPFSYGAFGEKREFFCSEQAFMWHKAVFFGDAENAALILSEQHDPYKCKMLGRAVRGYDDTKWSAVRYDVFLRVNVEKFSQNENLKSFILQDRFEGKMFVEASPSDKIWGIMMPIGNPDIVDSRNWHGQNLLGKCLTDVRKLIKAEK